MPPNLSAFILAVNSRVLDIRGKLGDLVGGHEIHGGNEFKGLDVGHDFKGLDGSYEFKGADGGFKFKGPISRHEFMGLDDGREFQGLDVGGISENVL